MYIVQWHSNVKESDWWTIVRLSMHMQNQEISSATQSLADFLTYSKKKEASHISVTPRLCQ